MKTLNDLLETKPTKCTNCCFGDASKCADGGMFYCKELGIPIATPEKSYCVCYRGFKHEAE